MKLLMCISIAASITAVFSATIDIERTIKQVQSILQENSTLPRLSREEIVELLNDIRSRDATGISLSINPKEISVKQIVQSESNIENQSYDLSETQKTEDNLVDVNTFKETQPFHSDVESTTKTATTLMVVLPYTPRDGSSLQELYTKPPRTEVVPLSKTTKQPFLLKKTDSLSETLKNNAKVANDKRQEFSQELQAFLDAHGLRGNSEKDSFLLPLDGFKPLPSFKSIDGSVELPENILLTYDLVSSSSELRAHADQESTQSQNQFLFEPLRPELPIELDEISIPYDLPKVRKPKSILLEPLDNESVKVIPLSKGPMPLEFEKNVLGSEINKRQTNDSTTTSSTNMPESTTTQIEADKSEAMFTATTNTDTGASITDLEDSFGGSLPEKPGDSQLPPPKKNGFYWMLDWNSFLEVGDGRTKVNIRLEPKLGDPQMFIPVNVP